MAIKSTNLSDFGLNMINADSSNWCNKGNCNAHPMHQLFPHLTLHNLYTSGLFGGFVRMLQAGLGPALGMVRSNHGHPWVSLWTSSWSLLDLLLNLTFIIFGSLVWLYLWSFEVHPYVFSWHKLSPLLNLLILMHIFIWWHSSWKIHPISFMHHLWKPHTQHNRTVGPQ